jgi:hypothetical protein
MDDIIDKMVLGEISKRGAIFFGELMAITPALFLPNGMIITLRNRDDPSVVPRARVRLCRDGRVIIDEGGIVATVVGNFAFVAHGHLPMTPIEDCGDPGV